MYGNFLFLVRILPNPDLSVIYCTCVGLEDMAYLVLAHKQYIVCLCGEML